MQYIIDFFTKGHQRSIEAKKNIIASLAIKSISFTINMILVPITINYINPTKYGIWLTLSSIILWFGFFDIGFGNGLRNKFAEAKVAGNYDQARIYVSTSYLALTLIFSAVWLMFFVANFFLDWSQLLNAPAEMAHELSTLALIVFGFFCTQVVLKIINIVLMADQKPAFSALLDMLGQLFVLLLIFILSKITRSSLLYLGLATGFAPLLVLILSSLLFYRKTYKPFAPSLKYVQFSHAKNMMRLGSMFFFIQVSIIVIFQTRNIIIAQLCGPESVAIFNIAFKYFSISYFVFGIIISPFWSAFTDAYTQNDFLWMKKVLKKLEIIALIFVILIIFQLIISQFVYILWIGKTIEIKPSVSIAVAIYFMTQIYHGLYTPLLNGMGKIKLQFYVISFLTFLVIPISLFLGIKFGLEGIISATIIANIFIVLYAPKQVHALINNKAKGIWNK